MHTITHWETPTLGGLAAELARDALAGVKQRGGLHRTEVPVHGGSKEAGGREEAAFYGRMTPEEQNDGKRIIMELSERRRRLRHELRIGERTEVSAFDQLVLGVTRAVRDVFLALLRMERNFRGRLFPSYEEIAEAAQCSRSRAHTALAALESLGLLDRLRRYTYTRKIGRGRSKQTSNAYRIKLPALLRKLLPFTRRPTPLPADDTWRREEAGREQEAMIEALPLDDRLRATMSDKAFAEDLIRLGKAVADREAHGEGLRVQKLDWTSQWILSVKSLLRSCPSRATRTPDGGLNAKGEPALAVPLHSIRRDRR